MTLHSVSGMWVMFYPSMEEGVLTLMRCVIDENSSSQKRMECNYLRSFSNGSTSE